MLEIVCCSTKGLLRTGNLDSRCCRKARERAICDRRMRMFSQGPRESRSKAWTGTGAHNHGAAGNRPCADSPVCIGLAGFLVFTPKKTRVHNISILMIDLFPIFTCGALGPRDIDVLR
jgi:hypothetical protein